MCAMNRDGFLEAALQSQACPEGFASLYGEFRVFQDLAIETLKEFHRVCESSGIPYVLTDGSLIGAVRNNGQIPWDYDVDVLVPLEYKTALVDALKKQLDNDFYFYCPEVDRSCRHFIMRVCPKGYRSEDLHVDVFYYIGGPDDVEARKEISRRLIELVRHRYLRLVSIRDVSHGRLRTYTGLTLRRILCLGVNLEKEYEEYNSLAGQWKISDANYLLRCDDYGWDSRYNVGHFRTFYVEDIANTLLLKTPDGTFRIPAGYDRYLSELYGDYMSEPNIDSCIAEVLKSYEHLQSAKKSS